MQNSPKGTGEREGSWYPAAALSPGCKAGGRGRVCRGPSSFGLQHVSYRVRRPVQPTSFPPREPAANRTITHLVNVPYVGWKIMIITLITVAVETIGDIS